MDRREFARLLAIGGAAPFLPKSSSFEKAYEAWEKPTAMPTRIGAPDEKYWASIRAQFVMDPKLGCMNAANLCPSSKPVLDVLYKTTSNMDTDPTSQNRAAITTGRENTRKSIADFLGVTIDEIMITRNTSESNNLVSSGLHLKPGDEVIITADNHPCNNTAWKNKAERFGFTVTELPVPNPHPGPDYWVNAFAKAITSKTKVMSFTHLTSTVGDLFPAKELCALGHDHGLLVMVDGAQGFGNLNVNLKDIDPDFYSGSAHKWPCGPKENGMLYVSERAQASTDPKLWPVIYSSYGGRGKLSRAFEANGQRDEPAMVAFGEAINFQNKVGRAEIEARGRELVTALIEGLSKIDGVKIWTSMDPTRRASVLAFQPGSLNQGQLLNALYTNDHIGAATRPNPDRPGIRFSPHFYNTHEEVDRAVGAIKKYMASGLPAATSAATPRPG